MSATFWVQLTDGSMVRKSAGEIADDDLVVVDGPGAFAGADSAQTQLDAEIEAAGGFEKWKANKLAGPSVGE